MPPSYVEKFLKIGNAMPYSIVAGISSSGKSTFINTQTDKSIVLPSSVSDTYALGNTTLVHYNTLRYANNKLEHAHRSFFCDSVLSRLLEDPRLCEISYVFCSRRELLVRINSRTTVENGHGRYPSRSIFPLVEGLNYGVFNRKWISLFDELAIRARLIHASDTNFTEVSFGEFEEIIDKY